jgi:hypothetical protein
VHDDGAGWLRWSGESATPREASPRWVGAPGPAHEDGRRVRRLGTDGAAETEVRCDRAAYWREATLGAWTNKWEGSSFIAAHCVGATQACASKERGR